MAVEITGYDLSTLPEQDQKYLETLSWRLDQPTGRCPLIAEPNEENSTARLAFLNRYSAIAAESTQRNQELLAKAMVESKNPTGGSGPLIRRIDAHNPGILDSRVNISCGVYSFRDLQEIARKPVNPIARVISAPKSIIISQTKAVEAGGIFNSIGRAFKGLFGRPKTEVAKSPPLSKLAFAALVGNMI